MNLRWLIGDHIDPKLHLTKRQKRDLKRVMNALPGARTRQTAVFILSTATFAMIFVVVFFVGSKGWLGTSAIGLIALIFAVLGIVNGSALYSITKPNYARAFEVLQLQICGRCGYSLQGHGQVDHPCPECGTTPASLMCPHCHAWMSRFSKHNNICIECGQNLPYARIVS